MVPVAHHQAVTYTLAPAFWPGLTLAAVALAYWPYEWVERERDQVVFTPWDDE